MDDVQKVLFAPYVRQPVNEKRIQGPQQEVHRELEYENHRILL
jgi:hypothetical protein